MHSPVGSAWYIGAALVVSGSSGNGFDCGWFYCLLDYPVGIPRWNFGADMCSICIGGEPVRHLYCGIYFSYLAYSVEGYYWGIGAD